MCLYSHEGTQKSSLLFVVEKIHVAHLVFLMHTQNRFSGYASRLAFFFLNVLHFLIIIKLILNGQKYYYGPQIEKVLFQVISNHLKSCMQFP